jgi:hypothetical protein
VVRVRDAAVAVVTVGRRSYDEVVKMNAWQSWRAIRGGQ